MHPAYIDTVAIVVPTKKGESIRLSLLNRHPSVDWEAIIYISEMSEFNSEAQSRLVGLINEDVESAEIHEMYSDTMDAIVSLTPLHTRAKMILRTGRTTLITPRESYRP